MPDVGGRGPRYGAPSILILLDESRFLVHWLIDFSPGQNLV
jgi:hypothetical protein